MPLLSFKVRILSSPFCCFNASTNVLRTDIKLLDCSPNFLISFLVKLCECCTGMAMCSCSHCEGQGSSLVLVAPASDVHFEWLWKFLVSLDGASLALFFLPCQGMRKKTSSCSRWGWDEISGSHSSWKRWLGIGVDYTGRWWDSHPWKSEWIWLYV